MGNGGKNCTAETLVEMPRRLRLHSSSDENEDSDDIDGTPPIGGRDPEESRKGTTTTRRLQILDSPDAEEEGEIGGFPVGPPSAGPVEPTTENHTVEISDDDDLPDVQDFFTPPSASPPRPEEEGRGGSPETASVEEHAGNCPVSETLQAIGARPRREWLLSCIQALTDSRQEFARLGGRELADLCLTKFLFADINFAGAGCLPPNVHTMHGVEIGGPFILQVDEIVNVSSPLRDRYKEVPSGNKRCLKLSMTDGVQRVFGVEYRPIKDLKVLAPAGFKVAVQNVYIRRGLLILVPEVLEVLGGSVEYLEAARRKFVDEVNKPPRGKRRRRGEEIAPLVQRARHAAWPPNVLGDMTASQHLNSPTSSHQAASPSATVRCYQEREAEESASRSTARNIISISSNMSTSVNSTRECHGNNDAQLHREEEVVHLAKQAHLAAMPLDGLDVLAMPVPLVSQHGVPVQPSYQGSFPIIVPDRNNEEIVTDELSLRRIKCYKVAEASSNAIPSVDGVRATNETSQIGTKERLEVADHLAEQTQLPAQSLCLGAPPPSLQEPILSEHADPSQPPGQASAPSMAHVEIVAGQLAVERSSNRLCKQTSNTVSAAHNINEKSRRPAIGTHANNGQIGMNHRAIAGSKSTMEEPEQHIMSGEKEIPFTYMAYLLAKHSLKKAHAKAKEPGIVTRGTIKCFLTGVKGFQFKGKSQFELQVYIDDGSLISEVLIDHNVVQKGIGYSTAEVTAALSSPNKDTVVKMKEVLKKFQHFLTKFEGTMLIEMNETSTVPIALEMNQGCTPSDGWMLLTRLKLYTAPGSSESRPTPINISP